MYYLPVFENLKAAEKNVFVMQRVAATAKTDKYCIAEQGTQLEPDPSHYAYCS